MNAPAPAGRRIRTVLAIVLAVLAGLLAPLAIVADWAWRQVENTDAFVAEYAPLAHETQFQDLVADRLTGAITDQLGAVGSSDAGRTLVGRVVDQFVASDEFASAFSVSLRLAHQQLRALLAAEPGAVQLNDGRLELQLGPFAEAVKTQLSQAGVPFVDRLPTITATITLAEIDPGTVSLARTGYRVLELLNGRLIWIALLAAVAAVALWPGVRRGLIVTGSALVTGVAVSAAAWLILSSGLRGRLAPASSALVQYVSTGAAAAMGPPLLAVAVAGAVTAFLGLLSHARPRSIANAG